MPFEGGTKFTSHLQFLFFLAFLSSHWLSFSGVSWFFITPSPILPQEILNRDEAKLFLDSKWICAKLSYFMLQGFTRSFGFWYVWSHILWVMLWILCSDKSKKSKQNSSESTNTLLPVAIADGLHERGSYNQFQYLNTKAQSRPGSL